MKNGTCVLCYSPLAPPILSKYIVLEEKIVTDLTEEIPQHEDDLFRYLSVPYRTCASEHGFKADVIVSCYHCGTVTALCGECQRPSSYVFESLLILPKCGDIVLRDRVSFIPVT